MKKSSERTIEITISYYGANKTRMHTFSKKGFWRRALCRHDYYVYVNAKECVDSYKHIPYFCLKCGKESWDKRCSDRVVSAYREYCTKTHDSVGCSNNEDIGSIDGCELGNWARDAGLWNCYDTICLNMPKFIEIIYRHRMDEYKKKEQV